MFVVSCQTFKGNTDQFMPVCHLLERGQVIARYVRIIPRSWHGHIALRAGFYGCESGTFFSQHMRSFYSMSNHFL